MREGQLLPKISNGWIAAFCKRCGLGSRLRSGEGASADFEAAARAKQRMPALLAALGCGAAKDMYNCDETALYPWAQPDRSYSFTPRKGYKKNTSRVTIMLCASADGFEREKPVVVGKANCPRNFKEKTGYDPRDRDVYWYANTNAWMTRVVFGDWISGFNDRMRMRGRKVVLTMDNASAHGMPGYDEDVVEGFKVVRLSHVTVVKLPPNTTSEIQPMDQGIIRSFKARYRNWLLDVLVEMWEGVQWQGDLSKMRPGLGECLREANRIWQALPDGCVYNCFKHSGLLPVEWPEPNVWEPVTALEVLKLSHCSVAMTIDKVRDHVAFPEPMTADEYIDGLPGEDLDSLSAEELIEMSEWEASEEGVDEVVRPASAVDGGDAIPLGRLADAFSLVSKHLDRDGAALYDRRWVTSFYNMHQRFKSDTARARIEGFSHKKK